MSKNKYQDVVLLGEDNLEYRLPKMPSEKEIDGYKLSSKKQKFVRQIFPSEDEFKKRNKDSQLELLTQELDRRIYGYWFFNNGVPTYITGSHYFFLNYWFMAAITTDGYGDYRAAQRKWAYFYDLVENDELCFGGIMLSQKRFSKSEFALAHLYNVATRGGVRSIGDKIIPDENALFGMQSLNATEAKNNLFKDRILRSHREIPNYLKPKSNYGQGKKSITSELTFFGDKDGENSTLALNNIIDHRPTHASAYQGKRPRMVYWDEAGSIEMMDILQAQTTVKQQLQIGKRAFGKMYLPCTLEDMTPKGAPLFEELWKQSNPNERDANGRTGSWLYRYFNPQYEGREDFIDEYGNSLIDEAKVFRKNEIDAAEKKGNLPQVRKIKRQYPESTKEAFDVVGGTYFSEIVIAKMEAIKEQLKDKPDIPRYKLAKISDEIVATPRADGNFWIKEFPKPNVDYFITIDGVATGSDYSSIEGSEVAIIVFKMYDPATNLPFETVAYYKHRPATINISFIHMKELAMLYNKYKGFKKMMPEASGSNHELLPQYMITQGLIDWVHKRVDYSKKGEIDTTKWGMPMNQYTIPYAKGRMNLILEEFPEAISMIGIIDDMLKGAEENADLRSALILFAFIVGHDFGKPPQKPKAEYKKIPRLVYNGRTSKIVWEKILVKKIEDIKEN